MTFIDQIKYLRINQVTLTQKEKEKSTLCMVTLRHHLQTPLLYSSAQICNHKFQCQNPNDLFKGLKNQEEQRKKKTNNLIQL